MISQSSIPRMKLPRLKLTPVVQTEAQVLRDVRRYLTAHPRVAWFARINSGAVQRRLAGAGMAHESCG